MLDAQLSRVGRRSTVNELAYLLVRVLATIDGPVVNASRAPNDVANFRHVASPTCYVATQPSQYARVGAHCHWSLDTGEVEPQVFTSNP